MHNKTFYFYLLICSGLVKYSSKDKYSDGQVLKLQAKSGAAFLYFYSDKHYVEDGFRIKYRWADVIWTYTFTYYSICTVINIILKIIYFKKSTVSDLHVHVHVLSSLGVQ